MKISENLYTIKSFIHKFLNRYHNNLNENLFFHSFLKWSYLTLNCLTHHKPMRAQTH